MIAYPDISPSFLTIGQFELRWYGLMYALSFVIGFFCPALTATKIRPV